MSGGRAVWSALAGLVAAALLGACGDGLAGETEQALGGGSQAPFLLEGPTAEAGIRTLEGTELYLVARDYAFEPTYVLLDDVKEHVKVTVHNDGDVVHTFTVDEQNIDVVVQPGEETKVEIMLPIEDPLRYHCRFHVERGMQGGIAALEAQQ